MQSKSRMTRRSLLATGGALGAAMALGPGRLRAQELQKVTIGMPGGNVAMTQIELMKRKGYLKELGLEPDFVVVTDGTKLVSAIMSGDVDLCPGAGFGQVLTAIEKGASLKVIGGCCVLIPQALFSANEEVKTLKDLEGRTIGTGAPGALLHNMTVAMLRKNGVDWNKVRFVNVGSSAQVFRAVAAGTVDAGPSLVDVYDQQEKYGVHVVADYWTEIPQYPYQAAFTATRTIESDREKLVKTLAAFGRLYDFLQSDGSEAEFVDAWASASGGGEAEAKTQWNFLNKAKPFDLMLKQDSIDYLQALNLELGIQQKQVPLDVLTDFTLATEAKALIG